MVSPAQRSRLVPAMEGVRWAFSCGTWLPSRAEWLLAVRSIQPEEKERIGQFVFARDAKAAMVLLQVWGAESRGRSRCGGGARGASGPAPFVCRGGLAAGGGSGPSPGAGGAPRGHCLCGRSPGPNRAPRARPRGTCPRALCTCRAPHTATGRSGSLGEACASLLVPESPGPGGGMPPRLPFPTA